MSFLLDTNIVSAHIKQPSGLAHRFCISRPSSWVNFTSAHTRADPAILLKPIRALLADLQILDFDTPCAEQFGALRSTLRRQGIAVDSPDLIIASTALVYGLTVVTHNTADFRHIPGLRLEDWLTP